MSSFQNTLFQQDEIYFINNTNIYKSVDTVTDLES